MNTNIVNFQDKYSKLLADLDEKITTRRNDFADDAGRKFDQVDRDNDHLQNEVDRERSDRIKESEENLAKLNTAIQRVEDCVKSEVEARTAGHHRIDNKIDQTNKNLNQTLDDARAERERKVKELRDLHSYEIQQQQRMVQDFSDKVVSGHQMVQEANHVTTNAMKAIQHRLSEQDSILDELSKVVRSIQETLDVVGKDA